MSTLAEVSSSVTTQFFFFVDDLSSLTKYIKSAVPSFNYLTYRPSTRELLIYTTTTISPVNIQSILSLLLNAYIAGPNTQRGGVQIGADVWLSNLSSFQNGVPIYLKTPVASTDTSDAISTTTGSISSLGGVSLAKNLFVGQNASVDSLTIRSGGITTGNLIAISTQDATSTATGSIITYGGIGIAKSLVVGGTGTMSNCLISGTGSFGNVSISGNLTTANLVTTTTTSQISTINTIIVTSTIDSTSPLTGSITTAGGIGISGSLSIGNTIRAPTSIFGTANFTSTSDSSIYSNGGLTILKTGTFGNSNILGTTTTQVLSVNGTTSLTGPFLANVSTFNDIVTMNNGLVSTSGIITSALSVQNLLQGSAATFTGQLSASNIVLSNDITATTGNFLISKPRTLMVLSTTDTTSPTTGALTVAGGVGVNSSLSVGGSLTVNNFSTLTGGLTTSTINASGAITSNTFNTTNVNTSTLFVTSTTDASSFSSGCLIVSGGMSLQKSIYIQGNAVINGNITTSGNSFTTGSTTTLGNTSTSGTTLTSGLTSTGNVSVTSTTDYTSLVTQGGATIQKNMIILSTGDSTSTATGCLVVSGGLGVAKNAFIGSSLSVGGNTIVSGTVDTTAVGTGALIVGGGVSVAKSLFIGGTMDSTGPSTGSLSVLGGSSIGLSLFVGSTNNSTSTTTGSLVVSGGVGIAKCVYISGGLESYSFSSGTLVVTGGVGILKSVNIAGTVGIINSRQSTNTTTGALTVTGGIGTTGNVNIGGNVTITSTTASLSTSSGALILSGGLGVQGTVNTGPLYVSGVQVPYLAGTNITVGSATISTIANPTFTSVTATNTTVSGTTTVSQLNATTVTATNLTVGGNTLFYIAGSNLSSFGNTISVIASPTFSGIVNITTTAQASSSTTGSLVIAGGAGISGGLYVGSNIYTNGVQVPYFGSSNIVVSNGSISLANNPQITGTNPSTSTTTGALTIAGGLGVAGNIYSGNVYSNGVLLGTPYLSGQNISISGNTISIINGPSFSGNVAISSSTPSTSATTGALTVAGGVGVSGSIYSSNYYSNGVLIPYIAGSNLSVSGVTISVTNSPTFSGTLAVTSTTMSSSSSTGALIVSGGVGISGNLYAGNVYSNGVLLGAPYTAGTNITVIGSIISVSNSPLFSGQITITNTTASVGVTSGAIVVSGGMGVSGTVYATSYFSNGIQVPYLAGSNLTISGVTISLLNSPTFSGNLTVSSTTSSNSTTTGAMTISGGLGVVGSIYGGNVYSNGLLLGVAYTAGNNITVNSNVISVSNSPIFTGVITTTNTTTSTSVASGALVVAGGLGVSGNSYLANVYTNGVLLGVPYIAGTNLSLVGTTFSVSNSPSFSGNVIVTSTTVSISSTTGSVVVSGGLGVSGASYLGNIFSNGIAIPYLTGSNITVSGATISVATSPTFTGPVTISNGTVSTSMTTGSLIVSGGLGISGTSYLGNVYTNGVLLGVPYTSGTNITITSNIVSVSNSPSFSGDLTVNSTTASTSSITGALVVSGGIGIGGTSYFASVYSNGVLLGVPYSAGLNVNISGYVISISNTPSFSGNVSIASTTPSTSTTSGALTINGGLGIVGNIYAGNVYSNGSLLGVAYTAGVNTVIVGNSISVSNNPTFTGNVSITSTIQSINVSTGALTISGGVGVSGNLYAGAIYSNGILLGVPYTGGTNITVAGTVISVTTSPIFSGNVTISNTTASTSTLTGALTVAGGIGVRGVINSNGITSTGIINQLNTTPSTSSTNGALTVAGGVGVNGTINTRNINVLATTISSGTTSGALIVAGGVGISGNLYIGGNTILGGNLTLSGNTTTINTSVLSVSDNLVIVNSSPAGTYDGGLLVKRFQPQNNLGTGDVVGDIAKTIGNAQGGTVTSITLSNGASTTDNYYNSWWIKITSGTGVNQVRRVSAYVGSTRVATILTTANETASPQTPPTGADFIIIPDTTSVYSLYGSAFSAHYFSAINKEWVVGYATSDPGVTPLTLIDYSNFHCNNLMTEGCLNVKCTFPSTSITTGAFTVTGGVGVSGSIYAGNMYSNGILLGVPYTAGTNTIFNGNIISVSSSPTFTGNITTTSTTVSSSTTSGAVVISGGLGVAGTINAGNVFSNGVMIPYFVGSNLAISGATISLISNPTLSGDLTINSTTISSSTSTGAVVVSGGIGVTGTSYFGNMYSNGILLGVPYIAGTNTVVTSNVISVTGNPVFSTIVLTGTTPSTSTGTGSLVIAGGLGISGTTYASSIYSNGVLLGVPYVGGTNVIVSGNIISVTNSPTFSGITSVTSTIGSTSTTTGAVVISGGLGVVGSSYLGNVYSNGTLLGVPYTSGTNVTITAGNVVSVNNSPTFSGSLTVTNTNPSTSTITGAIIVSGGVGISGSVYATSIYSNGVLIPYLAGGNIVISGATLSVATSPSFNSVNITSNIASTSTTSGALTVSGGIGVTGSIFAGNIYSNGVLLGLSYTAGTNISLTGNIVSVSNTPTFSGNTTITSTTISSSTTTGALVVSGGIGTNGTSYFKNIYSNGVLLGIPYTSGTNVSISSNIISISNSPIFSGGVAITSTTISSSTSSGALVVSGGLGVTGNVYAGNLYSNGILVPNNAGTNIVLVGSVISVNNSPVFSGILSITATTASNSTVTGALIVSGGIGVTGSSYLGNVYSNGILLGVPYVGGTNTVINGNTISVTNSPTFSGSVSITITTPSTSTATGALVISGGVGVSGNINASNYFTNGIQIPYLGGSNISISGATVSVVNTPTFTGNVVLNSTTASNSVTTGALTVVGGVGIVGNLYAGNIYSNGVILGQNLIVPGSNLAVNGNIVSVVSAPTFSGNLTVSSTTTSTSSLTGALTVAGGVGVSGPIFSNNIQIPTVAGSNLLFTGSTVSVISAPTFSGSVVINSTTLCTSTLTGALTVVGGIGTQGSIFSGQHTITSTSASTSTTSGALVVLGGIGTQGAIFSGQHTITSTVPSTSTTSGSIITAGGVGIQGNCNIGGTLTLSNTTTITPVSGTKTIFLDASSGSLKSIDPSGKTTFTTTGDLLTTPADLLSFSSTKSLPMRVPPGPTGSLLSVDPSTESGLAWKTSSQLQIQTGSQTSRSCQVLKSIDQLIPNTGSADIIFGTELFIDHDYFVPSIGTNYVWIRNAGSYLINARLTSYSLAGSGSQRVDVLVDNTCTNSNYTTNSTNSVYLTNNVPQVKTGNSTGPDSADLSCVLVVGSGGAYVKLQVTMLYNNNLMLGLGQTTINLGAEQCFLNILYIPGAIYADVSNFGGSNQALTGTVSNIFMSSSQVLQSPFAYISGQSGITINGAGRLFIFTRMGTLNTQVTPTFTSAYTRVSLNLSGMVGSQAGSTCLIPLGTNAGKSSVCWAGSINCNSGDVVRLMGAIDAGSSTFASSGSGDCGMVLVFIPSFTFGNPQYWNGYNATTSSSILGTTFQDVPLSIVSQANTNFSFTPGTSEVTVNLSGVYIISANISISNPTSITTTTLFGQVVYTLDNGSTYYTLRGTLGQKIVATRGSLCLFSVIQVMSGTRLKLQAMTDTGGAIYLADSINFNIAVPEPATFATTGMVPFGSYYDFAQCNDSVPLVSSANWTERIRLQTVYQPSAMYKIYTNCYGVITSGLSFRITDYGPGGTANVINLYTVVYSGPSSISMSSNYNYSRYIYLPAGVHNIVLDINTNNTSGALTSVILELFRVV